MIDDTQETVERIQPELIPAGAEPQASAISPSYITFEQALMARLAYHMAGTGMDDDDVESLGRVFIQRVEAKMLRLRDGQLKHGGNFLADVDHDNERRQEADDAEWYDIAAIINNNTSLRVKI